MAFSTSVLLLLGWHMGSLHPLEKVLTLVLAFGPFLVLAVVIWLRRRADELEDDGRPHDGEQEAARREETP